MLVSCRHPARPFGRRSLSGVWIVLCLLAVPANPPAAGAAGETRASSLILQPEDHTIVGNNAALFSSLLNDVPPALAGHADLDGMTHRIIGDISPRLAFFFEGTAGIPAANHPALQTVRALAANQQLALEYQATTLDDGAVLFGILLFRAYPTLELAWEAHPYESVALEAGAWRHPIADLGDVEEIRNVDGGSTLVLTTAAARRIDQLSEIHGHRTYRLRGRLLVDAENLGTYTWVPGVRTIPGLPKNVLRPLEDPKGTRTVTTALADLHRECADHARAREHVRTELGLPESVAWTVASTAPATTEPFYTAIVATPDLDGDARMLPRVKNAADTPWLSILAGAEQCAPIPGHWQFARAEGGAGFVPRKPEGDVSAARDATFEAFLRRNLGRDMAVIMQGRVVGVLPIRTARPEALPLTRISRDTGDRMASLWQAANPGSDPVPAAETTARRAGPSTDSFQVRLMAEPQDREVIPVTHFAAPGMARGVVVAVRDEVILDSHAVTGVQLEERDDKVYLRLSLTPEGQDALDGACFSNLGKQLAIVYDGKLLCAPTIRDWDQVELAFNGLDADWPDVARKLAAYLGQRPGSGT